MTGHSEKSEGSSPPMRGVRTLVSILYTDELDHPRLCGEYEAFVDELLREVGSSPPMRGVQIAEKVNENKNRIIPAYAGSTHL